MLVKNSEFVRVTAASRKNQDPQKPNEDAFWIGVQSRAFCVADGITRARLVDGSYPNPSPASRVAEIVASTAESLLREAAPGCMSEKFVLDVLRLANGNIRSYVDHCEDRRLVSFDAPAAVATVLAFGQHEAFFAHIGDCAILRFAGGDICSPQRITVDQTAEVRKWIIQTRSISHDKKLEFVRASIRNHRSHPLAFGVLSGEAEGLHFVQTGSQEAVPGDLFLLCSDGLEVVLTHLHDQHVRELISRRDVDGLIDCAEELDKQLRRRSDDKTLVLIDLLA